MRTPQTCSNISHGKLQENHTEDDEESVVSREICQSIGSSSSFSLQECINEFRSKRMQNSSQSNQNTDDDLIFQNNSNKQNERISKPCKDGFCYCFTSDSDDFRSHRREEKRKGRKSDSTGQQTSDVSNSKSNVTRRETFPLHSKKRHDAPPKNGFTRTVTAISKLEESSPNTRAPLIHIVQEIRHNCVVSEVRVNKQKIRQKTSPTKKRVISEKKVINSLSDLPNYTAGVSEIESLAEKFQNSSLNTSAKSSDKNGGRLLQKRLSGTTTEFKPRNLSTPPRKPPRNVVQINNDQTSIGTAPSIREAEKILDEFLLRKGIPVPQKRRTSQDKSNRKSYPLTEGITAKSRSKFAYEKPLPSCPSLSDIEHLGSEKYAESCDLLLEQPAVNWNQQKIREMLNIDEKSKNFNSTNPQCGPQVGWSVPSQLDIDTVDGTDHNLVANITSKCTPVKTEMFNKKTESQKLILAEQLKNIVSNSPWTGKKAKDKQHLKKSNSFLSASKTKLLRFVTKKTPPKNKSIGVQTRVGDDRSTPNLQSPPGSYFSNTPGKSSKSSQTEFDFSRTINSPKREKVPQRKLLFPARNVKETRLNSKTNQTYHSYNSDLDKDFTLSKMGQVLSNIKCRLEASDDLAVGTFRDIKRKEAVAAAAAAALSYDCVDGFDYQRAYHTSAQADIHNEAEPSYSEIEEDSLLITGSPVVENTNAIEHFFVGSDPTAIYAKINKTPKKSKPHSNSFNNVLEQNSPPKLRHVSKTDLSVQSEIFLENLTAESNTYGNRLHDREREKVQNVSQEEREFEGINLDDSYATVDSFRETLDKESDAVSYEYPDESINPINEGTCAGNQSTPKKAMHLTKFGAEMASNDDLHHTESCPTTPGWLSTYAQDFNPREDSISLQEESVTNVEKPGISSIWKYRTLKNKLSQSIRKSRHFLKHERKRITSSLNLPKPMSANQSGERWDESSLCLTNLFTMDESAPVNDQLTQAVGICRQYPELETSPEMVEAERLLLFSTLKKDVKNPNSSIPLRDARAKGCMDIKTLRLPIKENNDQEIFFNFYYIGVFSCGKQIKSTQSAECKNGEAIFRNCNILFDNIEPESEVRCDIFMLRLRKVSTSRKPLSKAKKLSLASTSSEEILSRFRPHASFALHPRDFVPYTLMEGCEEANDESLFLHAVGSFKLPVKPQARNTNLLNEVYVQAEVKQFLKKISKKGFLHVQDMNKKHSWNLRWCELDSLSLRIWNSPNDVSINEPVNVVDLGKCISKPPLVLAPREVCARSRSFGLEFESIELHSGYFFSADNQIDLNHWMCALNEVLEFIAAWMK